MTALVRDPATGEYVPDPRPPWPVEVIVDDRSWFLLVGDEPRPCPSRWHAYECALPEGHPGMHATEGNMTRWPDVADTRTTIDTEGRGENDGR